MDRVGKRIKELRTINKVSANKLASALDIDPSNISKIENGVSGPSLDLLFRICDYFEISVSDFFNDGINTEILPDEIKELLKHSRGLNSEQIQAINNLIKSFKR